MYSGVVDMLAGEAAADHVPSGKDDPWTRRIRKIQEEKNKVLSSPVEAGIGAVILNDAVKEWNRGRKELLEEKLRDVAKMIDKFAVEVDYIKGRDSVVGR